MRTFEKPTDPLPEKQKTSRFEKYKEAYVSSLERITESIPWEVISSLHRSKKAFLIGAILASGEIQAQQLPEQPPKDSKGVLMEKLYASKEENVDDLLEEIRQAHKEDTIDSTALFSKISKQENGNIQQRFHNKAENRRTFKNIRLSSEMEFLKVSGQNDQETQTYSWETLRGEELPDSIIEEEDSHIQSTATGKTYREAFFNALIALNNQVKVSIRSAERMTGKDSNQNAYASYILTEGDNYFENITIVRSEQVKTSPEQETRVTLRALLGSKAENQK